MVATLRRCALALTVTLILMLLILGVVKHFVNESLHGAIKSSTLMRTDLPALITYLGSEMSDRKREDARSEAGPGTWIPHLCPHYRKLGHGSLFWTPPTPNTIFFLQTSCQVSLTTREACVVESAAHHHPHRPVLVLMAAPTLNHTHPLIKVLTSLANVRVGWLDLDRVFSEEPLRTWHARRTWLTIPNERSVAALVSDAARLELLRRYGGTYLDLDTLCLRPLPRQANFLPRISDRLVINCVMSFPPRHRLMQSVVDELPSVWDPSRYTSIGADLLTRHLHLLCPDNFTIPSSVPPHQAETCGDVTVFPAHAFVPFSNGSDLKYIFTEGEGLGASFMRRDDVYTLHLFNHLTSRVPLNPYGDSILKEAAEKNCPWVMRVVRENKLYL